MTDQDRLRAGAHAIREIVGPDAFVMNLIANELDNDADRIDAGEPVTALPESLTLADGFVADLSGGE